MADSDNTYGAGVAEYLEKSEGSIPSITLIEVLEFTKTVVYGIGQEMTLRNEDGSVSGTVPELERLYSALLEGQYALEEYIG
jgi:hypothetical protein